MIETVAQPTKRDTQRENRRWLMIPFVVAIIFHFPVLFNSLVWDDATLIAQNPALDDPSYLSKVFLRDYGLELAGIPRGYYRPAFMVLTYAIHRLLGESAFPYHLLSLGSFAFFSIFVTYLFHRLTGRRQKTLALLGGCVFAAHPNNTEIVATYAALPDIMINFAAALGVLVLMARPSGAVLARPLARFAIAIVIALLAGLSKEGAYFLVGAVAAVAGLSGLRGRRSARASRILVALGLICGLAGALMIRKAAHIPSVRMEHLLAPYYAQGAPRALWGLGTALRLFLFPGETSYMREVALKPAQWAAWIMIGLTAFFALLVAWAIWKRRPVIALALGWWGGGIYTLCLAVATGVPYSERYLAIAPAVFLLALAVRSSRIRAARRVPALGPSLLTGKRLALLFGGYLVFCGALTLNGTTKCRNALSFWKTAVEEQPDAFNPYHGLAYTLFWDYGDFEQVEFLAQTAVRKHPKHPSLWKTVLLLGRIRQVEGRYDEALVQLDWAARLNPGIAGIHSARANCLGSLGRIEEGLEAIWRAIDLDPKDASFRYQWVRLAALSPKIAIPEILAEVKKIEAGGGVIPPEYRTAEGIENLRSKPPANSIVPAEPGTKEKEGFGVGA